MHLSPDQGASSRENPDDLDLLVIARNVFIFFRKNAFRLIISALVGLFCGVILFFSLPKFYTSSLLMESDAISNLEAKAIVENWSSMLKNSGYPILMKDMECERKTLSNTMRLTAEPLNTLNESIPGFFIKVTVYDTSRLMALQAALLNGFKNNGYIRRKVEIHRQATISQIKKADEELEKLDSTKEFIQGTVETVKKDKSPLILDVSALSSQRIGLLDRKLTLQEKLEFIDGVQLIEGFSAVSGPKPGLLTFFGGGLLCGFLIGYLLILFATLKRKVDMVNPPSA